MFGKAKATYWAAILLPPVLAGALWTAKSAWQRHSVDTQVQILWRGETVRTLALPFPDAKTFSVHGTQVRAEGDAVWVESAECPDQVCVQTGKISKNGESILCLPARVEVRVTALRGGFDALAY